MTSMTDVTTILSQIEDGDPAAAEQLLPLVYSELRKLAAARLANEKPGQTLQATALVHEAYLRLVDPDQAQAWDSRGHFFAAAAESMRRILVDRARRKQADKPGGDWQRVELREEDGIISSEPQQLLILDEALSKLSADEPEIAEVVKLHIFAGLSIDQVAQALGVSRATAYRHWTYARAWLRAEMR